MTTFDKREEPFERQFVHDEVAGSRPSRAAISGSGSGRPGGWAGPAPKLSPMQATGRHRTPASQVEVATANAARWTPGHPAACQLESISVARLGFRGHRREAAACRERLDQRSMA